MVGGFIAVVCSDISVLYRVQSERVTAIPCTTGFGTRPRNCDLIGCHLDTRVVLQLEGDPFRELLHGTIQEFLRGA
jgi:hypothetical protein